MFTLEKICNVGVSNIADWVKVIPIEDWPQQSKCDEQLRPAMVTDLKWHNFGNKVQPCINDVMTNFSHNAAYNYLLSIIMPKHVIDPHIDEQPVSWVCRIHVPLITNVECLFGIGDEVHHLRVGCAYAVNTRKEHMIINGGDEPRIHLMFDVKLLLN